MNKLAPFEWKETRYINSIQTYAAILLSISYERYEQVELIHPTWYPACLPSSQVRPRLSQRLMQINIVALTPATDQAAVRQYVHLT